MAASRWIVLLFAASTALSAPPPERPLTRSAARLDLFGPSLLLRSDSLTAPADGNQFVKKSAGLAAIYSLLLPGMGELYSGDFASGKYFLIAEGLLWITYVAFEVTGNSLRDDSRVYAAAHAGVITAGKNDQFYVDVGNFASLADYNDKKLRDRELSLVYDASLGYAWQWDSEAARLTFRDQRVRSENMYNNQKFVVAGIIINHVASAINAARAAIVRNSSDPLGDLRLSAGVTGSPLAPSGVSVTLTKGL
jgi:hypothetical protein